MKISDFKSAQSNDYGSNWFKASVIKELCVTT